MLLAMIIIVYLSTNVLYNYSLLVYTYIIYLLFIRINSRAFISSSYNRSSKLTERNVQRESVVADVLQETSVVKK